MALDSLQSMAFAEIRTVAGLLPRPVRVSHQVERRDQSTGRSGAGSIALVNKFCCLLKFSLISLSYSTILRKGQVDAGFGTSRVGIIGSPFRVFASCVRLRLIRLR